MPLSPHPDDARRKPLARLVLDVQRALNKVGSDSPEAAFVLLCAALGRIEQKPMDISAVATFIDKPRTSVLRHLVLLEKAGLVMRVPLGRRVVVVADASSPAMARLYDELEQAVNLTCNSLSALDSSTGDPSKSDSSTD